MSNYNVAIMIENSIIEAIVNRIEFTIIGFENNMIITKINGDWIKI